MTVRLYLNNLKDKSQTSVWRLLSASGLVGGCAFCFERAVSFFLCWLFEFLFWARILLVDEGTGLFARAKKGWWGLIPTVGDWGMWGLWGREKLGLIGFALGLFC